MTTTGKNQKQPKWNVDALDKQQLKNGLKRKQSKENFVKGNMRKPNLSISGIPSGQQDKKSNKLTKMFVNQSISHCRASSFGDSSIGFGLFPKEGAPPFVIGSEDLSIKSNID